MIPQSNRQLKVLAVVLPTLFWLVLMLLRRLLVQLVESWQAELIIFGIFLLGVILFAAWIFGIIEAREAEIREQSARLAALHEASLALTQEHDLSIVLQMVADLARQLVGARYGALGVLDEDGRAIDQFYTSGIDPEIRARIGQPPRGRGLLGVIIRDGKTVRVPEISKDPRSAGFPPNHPPMRSLLGVPIQVQRNVIGDLYLADKLESGQTDSLDPSGFTEQDQQIVEMFAVQAAIAIQNAQLYRRTQQLAVLQERERFGMDLHDGIIQSIYAIGLMLDNTQHQLGDIDSEARIDLNRAIQGLNGVIRDIRNYILDLRPERFQGRDLHRGLEELAMDLRANSFLAVELEVDNGELTALAPEQTVQILHIAQEALTNVRKHARAKHVRIRAHIRDGGLELLIEDDGIGVDPGALDGSPGNGLRNMRERAEALAGKLEIKRLEGGGTGIRLSVPVLAVDAPPAPEFQETSS